jgi:hypothetical protein
MMASMKSGNTYLSFLKYFSYATMFVFVSMHNGMNHIYINKLLLAGDSRKFGRRSDAPEPTAEGDM